MNQIHNVVRLFGCRNEAKKIIYKWKYCRDKRYTSYTLKNNSWLTLIKENSTVLGHGSIMMRFMCRIK